MPRFQTDDGLFDDLRPFFIRDQHEKVIGLAFEPSEAGRVLDALTALRSDVEVAARWAVSKGYISTPPRSVVDQLGADETPSGDAPGFQDCPGSETRPVAVNETGDRSLCTFCNQTIPIARHGADGEYRLIVHGRPVR